MLWSGRDRNILASADLAWHIALTFSSGTPPNAGGVNRSSNIVKNKKGALHFEPSCIEAREQRTHWWVSRFPKIPSRADIFRRPPKGIRLPAVLLAQLDRLATSSHDSDWTRGKSVDAAFRPCLFLLLHQLTGSAVIVSVGGAARAAFTDFPAPGYRIAATANLDCAPGRYVFAALVSEGCG